MSTSPNGKVAQATGPVAGRTTTTTTTKAAPAGGPTAAHLPKSASVDKFINEAMAGKPGKKKKEKVPVTRKQMITTIAAAVVVLGVVAGVYAYFGRPEVPPGKFPINQTTDKYVKGLVGKSF